MIRCLLTASLCLPFTAVAALPWTFAESVTVVGAGDSGHYHHLDGAGRRHIAAGRSQLALVWEDDRSGAPQVYAAIKPLEAQSFGLEFRLSEGKEAYEPAVAALPGDRWLVAWEQDGAIVARLIDAQGQGPLQILVPEGGRQVTLATDNVGRIAAVWVREQSGGQVVEAAELRLSERELVTEVPATAVAPIDDHPFQGYPAASWAPDGRLALAWEDRRAGHTRLFHSWRDPGRPFAAAIQLNEHSAPADTSGLGSGVMRVALAADDAGEVRAIWLDKRNPTSGYAVWGASSHDAGSSFGANQIVQDELGAVVPQWHAALAWGRPGFVAAWDDTREAWGDAAETGDVLLSWSTGDGWSPDLLVPGASGDGYQGSPALTVDANGDLHLAWIERDDLASPTRLRYLHARLTRPQP